MIYTIENDALLVEVNSLGSELWSVYDKHRGAHLLWQGDSAVWPRRSPILFPVCGQLRGGMATIQGQSCNIPLHGFARDYEHEVSSKTDDSITLLFTENDQTLENYPFQFALYTAYQLEGATLSCTFTVVNRSESELFFSAGFHSGFFADDSTVLRFGAPETADRYLQDENGLICGVEKEALKDVTEIKAAGAGFPGTQLLGGLHSGWVDIITNSRPTVRIGFAGSPYLAIWVKQFPVSFVCVEPWHGLPDWCDTDGELTRKGGVERLAAQAAFTCTQTISVT